MPAGHGRALRRGLEREDPAVRPGTPGRQDRVDAQERPHVEYLVSLPDSGAQEFVQRRFAVVGDEVTKPWMDPHGLVVHRPGQAAAAVDRAQHQAVRPLCDDERRQGAGDSRNVEIVADSRSRHR